MNILNTSLNDIKKEVNELKGNKENIVPEEVDRLNKKIEDIIKIVKNEQFLNYKGIRKSLDSVLVDISNTLDNIENKQPIDKIRKAICTLQSLTSSKHMQKKPGEVEKLPIKIKMGFICDLDAPDHNGAMASRLINFLKSNVPFITTRSILNAQGLSKDERIDKLDMRCVLLSMLLDNQKKWDIYTSSQNEEWLVFLPTSLLPDIQDVEKLEALDLKNDGNLKKISVEEALQYSQEKPSLDSFFHLFVDHPKGDKLFYIAGHGESNAVGGLDAENYDKFLSFLDQQQCRGLTVNSCYSGGESSLLNLPAYRQEDRDAVAKFNEKQDQRRFLTIVRSIGDFPTKASKAEENIGLYFDELAIFLEGTVESTSPQFRKMLEKVEANLPKNLTNRVQVHFAQRGDAPGGFRSIGEQGLGYPLTYAKLKAQKLEGELFKNKSEKKVIPLEINNPFIDIHPLIVDIPLKFHKQDPILLSMVPGDSQHFIQSIELDALDPLKFIDKTLDFHREAEVNVHKSFFISALMSKETLFEEVVMHITPQGSQCVYRHEGQYYISDGEISQPITPLQHALFIKETVVSTFPSDAAVRASSGGQESQEMFLETVNSPKFWISKDPLVQKFEGLQREGNIEKLLSFASSQELTFKDKQMLCFYLISRGQEDVALEVFKRNQLDPNAINDRQSPILYEVLLHKHFKFAEYLLENGANVNTQNKKGVSPLHQAIASGNEKVAKLLISHPFIELEVEDKSGLTPLYYAIPDHPELFHLLQSKGCSVDHVNRKGKTLLSMCIHYNLDKKVEFLLNEPTDPNLGNPSALTEAINQNDVALVEKLLKKGGRPFEQDLGGSIPFLEAIYQGNYKIVQLCLDREDFNGNVSDGKGIHPLVAALFSGQRQIIQALVNKNVQLPEAITKPNLILLNSYVEKCSRLGLIEPLQELLKMKLPSSRIIEKLIVMNVMKNNIDMMTDLIRDDYLSPQMLDRKLIQGAINSSKETTKMSELIRVCMEKGMNFLLALDLGLDYTTVIRSRMEITSSFSDEELESVISHMVKHRDVTLFKEFILKAQPDLNSNLKDSGISIFQKIIEMQDKDLIVQSLEQGADANIRNQEGFQIFGGIIAMGDLDLIDLFFQHGASLEAPEDQAVALFAAVQSGRADVLNFLLTKGCKISEEVFHNSHLMLQALDQGGVPMLAKILQMAHDFNINLNNMEAYAKEELFKVLMKRKENESFQAAELILKSGLSPIIDGKNVLLKYAKKKHGEEFASKIENLK